VFDKGASVRENFLLKCKGLNKKISLKNFVLRGSDLSLLVKSLSMFNLFGVAMTINALQPRTASVAIQIKPSGLS
jgi:hypothetical protein